MKITLERLRQIVTEEVIKEEIAPEDAQRTIVALLQGIPPNVTGDIMGAVYDEMYDADVSEPQPEPEEESFPTEYQPGGAEGDRPTMGFKEDLEKIIQEELEQLMREETPVGSDPKEITAAFKAVPDEASKLAQRVRADIVKMTAESPADPMSVATMVAGLITAEYRQ
jgi:hypothetical protein